MHSIYFGSGWVSLADLRENDNEGMKVQAS